MANILFGVVLLKCWVVYVNTPLYTVLSEQ